MENGWLSSLRWLFGDSGIQFWLGHSVLLALGSGLDQTIISPSGQRQQKQADRQLAPGLKARQKGPSNLQAVCLCDGSVQVPSSPSSPFSLSLLVLTPNHVAELSLQKVRAVPLCEWIWVWLLHSSSHLIMSLSCLHLGQAVHWLQKGQPTQPIWDRAPVSLLCPQHPQPLSPDLGPLFFPGPERAREGHQRKRKKGPSVPQWSGNIQPPMLKRMPMRKLALGAAW